MHASPGRPGHDPVARFRPARSRPGAEARADTAVTCQWKAWTMETQAERVFQVGQRLLDALGARGSALRVETYPGMSGYFLSFASRIEEASWGEAVVTILSAAQRVGRGWQLYGSADEVLEAMTDQPSVLGVEMLTCRASRGAARG